MTKKQKYLVIAGGILALLGIGGVAIASSRKKSKTSIIVEAPVGEFATPAEVKTKLGTRLRKEPSTSSSVIKTYMSGVLLLVIGDQKKDDGVWYNVKDSAGRIGWVRSDVINPVVEKKETLPQQKTQITFQESDTPPSIEDFPI